MSIYDSHKPAVSEGGLYLKIKADETVKLRISSEPAIFEAVGERDGQKTISTRYGWVVYNQETKQAQILQQSSTFFKNVAALAQDSEWGDPQDYDIKITRTGSSFNDTTYAVTPSTNRDKLSDEAQAAIDKVNLLEKLEASPFSQRVMWLSDWDKEATAAQKEPNHSREVKAVKAVGDSKKEDVVIEDIDEVEEPDLSQIPF